MSVRGTGAGSCLPHAEVFRAVEPGQRLLINDGKIALRVESVDEDRIETTALNDGELSDRKGVNVPDAVLPLPALTEKDRRDLDFALDQEVDWVALSFVQRPDDVAEARRLIAGRASLMAKIEKPRALDRLNEILDFSDGLMVARGDLGVELPPQKVPRVQKEIVELAREAGKPVVVATQMLDSMVSNPAPTRAEVSDVANTIYEGVDTIMLSAETAAGDYPVEAVKMMEAIALEAEADPQYARHIHFTQTAPQATTADAISAATGVGDAHRALRPCGMLHHVGLYGPPRQPGAAAGSPPGADALEGNCAPRRNLVERSRGHDPRRAGFRGDDWQGEADGTPARSSARPGIVWS